MASGKKGLGFRAARSALETCQSISEVLQLMSQSVRSLHAFVHKFQAAPTVHLVLLCSMLSAGWL